MWLLLVLGCSQPDMRGSRWRYRLDRIDNPLHYPKRHSYTGSFGCHNRPPSALLCQLQFAWLWHSIRSKTPPCSAHRPSHKPSGNASTQRHAWACCPNSSCTRMWECRLVCSGNPLHYRTGCSPRPQISPDCHRRTHHFWIPVSCSLCWVLSCTQDDFGRIFLPRS